MQAKGIHIILIRMAMVAVVAIGATLMLGAIKIKDNKACSKVHVTYRNGNLSGFLPVSEVLEALREVTGVEPVGSSLQHFKLDTIESKLESNPWIYDAQLYFDNNQVLHVVLDEAIPVARVMDRRANNYYLDKLGNQLPLSNSYRADLPVFTNVPVKLDTEDQNKTLERILGLSRAIVADSFWLAQAAQVEVLSNGKMEIVPAVGNHIIEAGYATDPANMLERLKLFYQAMAAAGKLADYERINASFAGQVVAQRMAFDVNKGAKHAAMEKYQEIVRQNKAIVDSASVSTGNGAGRIMAEVPIKQAGAEKGTQDNGEKNSRKEVVKPPEAVIEKGPEKAEVKPAETKQERKPKAVMPKQENN